MAKSPAALLPAGTFGCGAGVLDGWRSAATGAATAALCATAACADADGEATGLTTLALDGAACADVGFRGTMTLLFATATPAGAWGAGVGPAGRVAATAVGNGALPRDAG